MEEEREKMKAAQMVAIERAQMAAKRYSFTLEFTFIQRVGIHYTAESSKVADLLQPSSQLVSLAHHHRAQEWGSGPPSVPAILVPRQL